MQLLSFIGTNNYSDCVYGLGGRRAAPSKFPQIALPALLEGCTGVTVFETAEARDQHRDTLVECASAGGINLDFVLIPSGKSEAEQWEIFSIIDSVASRHREVALDVTHGFRTLPMIGMLTAAFLRVTGKVEVSRLLYGAWDATDAATGITPVFDLTPFLSLIDWLTASHVFLRSGNAAELGDLLREKHQSLWTKSSLSKAARPKSLASVGSSLEAAADSVLLLRRHQREGALESLNRQIENARLEIPEFAKPFSAILDSVQSAFSSLRGETELEIERRQMGWLLERGHPDAALTLAREWMVSWVAVRLGETQLPSTYESRKDYETFLNVASGHAHVNLDDLPERLRETVSGGDWVEIGKLWDRLREARNDLNHAGYSENAADAAGMQKKATELVKELMDYQS